MLKKKVLGEKAKKAFSSGGFAWKAAEDGSNQTKMFDWIPSTAESTMMPARNG